MKKITKLAVTIFALCFAWLSISTVAKAMDVTSLSASVSADSVTVKGSTEEGVYAVAITIYDKETSELVKYYTTQVDNSTFSETFQLPYGSYEIRVADYDGGSFSSALVILEEQTVCVHEFEEKVTPATCTEKGKITLVCKKCGEVSSDVKEIAATGHKTVKTGEKAATCTEAGYTGDEVCQTCKETVKKGTVIEKLGHSYQSTLKAATCTEDGEKILVCETCKDTIRETLKAVGHIYQNGVCSVCQAKDPDYKPQAEVEVVTKPEAQKAVDEVKNDIVNTVAESLKVVKAELEASGETVSTEKLIATVKEALNLKKSESEAVKNVVNSVSDKTLEKVITAVTENKEISMVVVAEPVSVEEIKQTAKADADKIEKLASDKGAVAQYLDLEVLIQAKDAQGKVETLGTVDQPTKEVTFTLSIPENLKKDGRVFYIIRVHANGAAETLTVNNNQDGTITFKTDKFSTYALAYADTPATTPDPTPTPNPTPSQDTTTVAATTPEKVSPKTGDGNKVAEWSAIFAAGLGAMLIALKKRRQH